MRRLSVALCLLFVSAALAQKDPKKEPPKKEPATAPAAAGGEAEIRCEFCGQQYRFDREEIGALFRAHGVPVEPPARLQ